MALASILCLGCRVLPASMLASSRHSTSESMRQGSKVHFNPPSLASFYTCHRVGHIFRPVIHASDRSPALPPRNDHKTARRTVLGASLILACALGIISGNLTTNSKAIAGPRELYQKAPQVEEHPSSLGKLALQSFLDLTLCLASDLERPIAPFRLPPRPSAEEVKDIKIHAVRLMKYGKTEEALNFLQNACDMYLHDPEPAYYVEMALVEILICQQKYKKALKCKCLSDDDPLRPSDARVFLYKAIIFTMLDYNEEAKLWWEKYLDTVEGAGSLPIR